jgi:phage terminase Nu1 subunit (DNA packaging protein)
MTEDDTVPTRNLTKHDLSRATGYPLKEIDRLVRAGLPARPGASKRDGLRFPSLAGAIEWIAEHRAAERAGPDDESTAGARRRLALAKARAAEIANAERVGQLCDTEFLTAWIAAAYGGVRDRLLGLSSEIAGLTEDQRHAVEEAVDSALTDISDEAWSGHFRLRKLKEETDKAIEQEGAAFDFG